VVVVLLWRCAGALGWALSGGGGGVVHLLPFADLTQ
jgi:hypothetical protein